MKKRITITVAIAVSVLTTISSCSQYTCATYAKGNTKKAQEQVILARK